MQKKIRVLEEEHAVPEIVGAVGQRRIIRINGHSGHGKTRLAKAITAALGWNRVTLDDYLRPYEPGLDFTARLDMERVLADVAGWSDRGVVLDGILLDRLVPADSFGPELKVLMLSLFSSAWSDDERKRAQKLGTRAYHNDFRPDLSADIVVLKAVD